jgi:hypothetical protein
MRRLPDREARKMELAILIFGLLVLGSRIRGNPHIMLR